MTELASKLWYGTFETNWKFETRPVDAKTKMISVKSHWVWHWNALIFAGKFGCSAGATVWLCRALKIPPLAVALAAVCVAVEMTVDGRWAEARLDAYAKANGWKVDWEAGQMPLPVYARLGTRSILSGFCFASGGVSLKHAVHCWGSLQRLAALGYGAFALWGLYYGASKGYNGCRNRLLTRPVTSWWNA